jgi:hypothetical protein
MTRRFSRRLDPIVAADTASCNRRVIHERDHCPTRCYVAVRAFARRRNDARSRLLCEWQLEQAAFVGAKVPPT